MSRRRPSCPAAACNDFLYLRIKRETSCSSSGHWPLHSWKKAFPLSTEEFFVCLFRIKSGSTLSTSPQKNRLPSNSVGENVCFRERSLRGASSSLLSFLSLSLPPPCSEMSESQARGTNFPSSHVENLLPPSTHERTNTTLARTLPPLKDRSSYKGRKEEEEQGREHDNNYASPYTGLVAMCRPRGPKNTSLERVSICLPCPYKAWKRGPSSLAQGFSRSQWQVFSPLPL